MPNAPLDPATILGWGVDADPDNDPTCPMRDRSHEDKGGRTWERPPLHAGRVEVLQFLEYDARAAVFGTPPPPRGLRAFSAEVDAGLAKENAAYQGDRAFSVPRRSRKTR